MPVGREHITGNGSVTLTAHRPSDWDEDERKWPR